MSKALANDDKLIAELNESNKEVAKADEEIDEAAPDEAHKKGDGKLVVAEEISEGHVGWPARKSNTIEFGSSLTHWWCSVKLFFVTLGGSFPFLFYLSFTGLMFIEETMQVLQTWYLGYWAQQYDERPAEEISAIL